MSESSEVKVTMIGKDWVFVSLESTKYGDKLTYEHKKTRKKKTVLRKSKYTPFIQDALNDLVEETPDDLE